MIWFQKGSENWAENKWNNSNHKHSTSNFMDLSKIETRKTITQKNSHFPYQKNEKCFELNNLILKQSRKKKSIKINKFNVKIIMNWGFVKSHSHKTTKKALGSLKQITNPYFSELITRSCKKIKVKK